MDPFGHLNLGFTLNGSPYATRSKLNCGLESTLTFAQPDTLFNCYDRFDDWYNASACMYYDVHRVRLRGRVTGQECGV